MQSRPDWYAEAMERLVVVVQELSLARSVAAIQEIVRHAARQLTGSDGATFVLRDGDRCYYADEDAIAPLWKGNRFPMSMCISGWVMLNRQSVVIEDIYQDARIPHVAYRPTFVKSLAMVPIRTKDPIGAIGLYWAAPCRPDEQQLKLIQALADTTAVAMENVTVHDQLEQRVRERTAEALAAKEEAERANLLKTRFLTAANHDLRQPLQSLGTYLSVLARRVAEPELQQACGQACRSVESMDELLDSLLDLHKLESGRVMPAFREFPILPLLQQVVSSHRLQAEGKGLRLELAGGDWIVRSDPGLLRRVVENLVGNAVRYTGQGGVTLRCRREGGVVRIAVIDTGVGIPEAALDTIFNDYVQLDNPSQDRSKGLGLGLSIVKQIAQALDHRLGVESRPGAGSTFFVEVPVAESERRSAMAPAQPQAQSARPLALLVEDDSAIADALQLVLDLDGIKTRHAAGCAAALALIEDGLRPAVLITDYRLPDGCGIDVVNDVRKALGTSIPALLLTGDTSLNSASLDGLGGCILLYKPVKPEQLAAAVESLAAGQHEAVHCGAMAQDHPRPEAAGEAALRQ